LTGIKIANWVLAQAKGGFPVHPENVKDSNTTFFERFTNKKSIQEQLAWYK